LNKKANIESALLVMLLVAGTTWYYYGHPELGSTRAASFLAAYKPVGAESPRIHHEGVQLQGDCIHAARMHSPQHWLCVTLSKGTGNLCLSCQLTRTGVPQEAI